MKYNFFCSAFFTGRLARALVRHIEVDTVGDAGQWDNDVVRDVRVNMKRKSLINRLLAVALSSVMTAGLVSGCSAPQEAATGQEQESESTEQAPEAPQPQEAAPESEDAALEEVEIADAAGWNESLYAVIEGVSDSDVTAVSYSGTAEGSLEGEDLEYLVRDDDSGNVRVDIPGLAPGTYSIRVETADKAFVKDDIEVDAFDRSGYAHFKYENGVGAYNNDGTLKDNAIVLYVTDENKNDVELTVDGVTVKGIGNILNSGGMAAEKKPEASVSGDSASGNDAASSGEDEVSENDVPRTSKGGIANTNQGIIKLLAENNIPLVVRFVGVVSDSGLYKTGEYDPTEPGLIEGLTAFSLDKEIVEEKGLEPMFDYGANQGDNGHMARMVSGRDITLEGIGTGATIDGWGFHFIASGSDKDTDRGESFEVRNLTFINTAEDAVGLEGNTEKNEEGKDDVNLDFTKGVERCWIHNNEFYCPTLTACAAAEGDKMEGDGSIDFKKGQYVTFSYNYFEGNHKTSLVGGNDSAIQFNVTYHHNHWYMCGSRAPASRNANIHMYNNISDMQTNYCQNTRANAYIFSEYNMFYACRNPQWVVGGAIKSYNDRITGALWEDVDDNLGATVVENKEDYVENECQYIAGGIRLDKFDTDPELSYIASGDYELQTDFGELRKVIASKTGTMKSVILGYEDAFDSVIPLELAEEAVVLAETVSGDETAAAEDKTEETVSETTVSADEAVSLPGVVPGGRIAFSLEKDGAVTVAYGSVKGVIVNENGECMLEGDGTTEVLPAGVYMIQSEKYTPGNYREGTPISFEEIEVKTFTVSY